MLIKPTREEGETYIDFAYELALDPSRSGYPTYADGIKTKEDFAEQPWRDMRNLTEADENAIARYFRDMLLDDYELKKVRKGSAWNPIRRLNDYERRKIVEVRR